MIFKKFRSAITGRYVTMDTAQADPDTTVGERLARTSPRCPECGEPLDFTVERPLTEPKWVANCPAHGRVAPASL